MSHTVHFDAQQGILVATQTGRVTLASRLQLFQEGKAMIPEGIQPRVLSDLRDAEIAMSSEELMRYGEIAAKDPCSRRARVATVYRSDTPLNYLGENMFMLQGEHVRVASFTSITEAYQWLSEE